MQQDEDKIARLRTDAERGAAPVLFRLLPFLIAAVVQMSHEPKQIETCSFY